MSFRVGPGGHEHDRHERQGSVSLQSRADFDAVDLGHHDVEQDQVRMVSARDGERLGAVTRLKQFVAVDIEASKEISRFVSLSSAMRMRGGSCMAATFASGHKLRIFARSWRGLKRLGDVGIAARRACFVLIAAQRIRGDDDNRDSAIARIRLETPCRFIAVENRQAGCPSR